MIHKEAWEKPIPLRCQARRFRRLLSLLWFHDLCVQLINSVLCFFKIRAVICVVLEQLLKTLNIHVDLQKHFGRNISGQESSQTSWKF